MKETKHSHYTLHSRKPYDKPKPKADEDKSRQKTAPKAVWFNEDLIKKIYENFTSLKIPKNITDAPVTFETLTETSSEFLDVADKLPPLITVEKIMKVHNPYLRLAFEIRRESDYDGRKPLMLFHGTKLNYVESICKFNFDWRLSGRERGHRHGKGVNFTPKARFALFFCDKESDLKVMILAEVMVVDRIVGHSEMVVPPRGYDTTMKRNRSVLVKYYDHDFYPTYLIYFHKRTKRDHSCD